MSQIGHFFKQNEDAVMKGIVTLFGACALGMGLYYSPTIQKKATEWKDNVERGYTATVNHVEKAALGYAMRR